MPSIHETAYPRLKAAIPNKDLEDLFTPKSDEIALAATYARGGKGKVCFLIQLKTFQRLGYFTLTREVPQRIVNHISSYLATEIQPGDLEKYDVSGSRQRHTAVIREYHGVQAVDDGAKSLLASIMQEAASTKDDLADIINVGMEELIRRRFELPGFTVLIKTARRCRTIVNKQFYEQIAGKLDRNRRADINRILQKEESVQHTPWQTLKLDPGSPTLNHLRELVKHLQWLKSMSMPIDMFEGIPDAKLRHFAAEAKSLDAARMREMEANKRYALCAVLIKMQTAKRLDDLATMFIKRMKKIHNKA